MSFARRLVITLAIPLALYFASKHLLLPGIPEDLAETGTRVNLGVFALGVAPIVSAYWLVEVAAFLVPRWSRLRHGSPEARAKLDRAARLLTLALAALQAFGIATQLKALEGGDFMSSGTAIRTSVPIVIVTLVGGVCLQFIAARFISQRGLANGFVVLIGASQLVGLGESFMEAIGRRSAAGTGIAAARAHAATPRELAFTGFALSTSR